jgi:hypothetical protein
MDVYYISYRWQSEGIFLRLLLLFDDKLMAIFIAVAVKFLCPGVVVFN